MRVLAPVCKALLLLVCSAVLALAVALALLHFNPSSLIPLAERGAKYFLGRDVHVQALTRVSLGQDTSIELRGLELANANWAGPEPMLFAGHLRLVVSLPSLWGGGSILVREAEIKQLTLSLLAAEGQAPNWEMPIRLDSSEPEDESEDILFPVIIERLHLADIGIDYRDADQHVDIAIEYLQKSRDASSGLSDLSLAGVVNELPLSGAGKIGPTHALQTGKNLELDLSLTLGKMKIEALGSVADALALAGVDLDLNIRAPRSRSILDLLGLQDVRDGPLVFEGQLEDAAPGLRIEAEGELAGFGLGAHGVIGIPGALDDIELAFYLDGPSMAEAGAVLGVAGFKNVPFHLSGEVGRRGSALTIENGKFHAAQGHISLSGVLPNFPGIDDWQVDIEGRQLELSVVGPMTGVEGLPELLCDIDGRLYSDGQGVELLNLKITDGDVELLVDGVVGELPDYLDTVLQMRFSGNDLTRMQSLIGLETLPAVPYELAGELSRNADGWQIAKARLLSQGFRVEATVDLDALVDPQRLDGQISLSSPDVPAVLRHYGMELETAAPLPVRLSGDVRLAGGGFELSAIEGDVGAVTVSGRGWLSAEEGFAGTRVTLEAQADSMGEAIAAFSNVKLPGQPFQLSLDAAYHAPLVSIERMQASMGAHTLAGHLTLEGNGEQQLARGQIRLQGKSTRDLMALAGLDVDIGDSAYTASSKLEMNARFLTLERLHIEAANSDLDGEVHLELGEIPRLDVNLRSRELHLSSIFPVLDAIKLEEKVPEQISESALVEPPTPKEMKARVIPDTPLPLAWIRRLNGHWRYSVDRVYERGTIAARLLLDLDLEEGVLKTREFGWDGTISKGWLDLVIDARKTPYRMEFKLATDRIPLFWLVAGREVPRQKSTYRGSMSAVGSTVREVAASLDGELILRASGAQLSNKGLDLILGDVVGSVFDRLNPITQAEQYTTVECLAGALRAENGLLNIDPGMVMRTNKIDTVSRGTVDLRSEALSISFNTRSRKGIGISAGKAITPFLMVAGNLANPWLTVDPEAVAISGTAAIATGGLSILAEGLYDRWVATATNPCKDIFRKIGEDNDYKPLLAFPEPGLKGISPDNIRP